MKKPFLTLILLTLATTLSAQFWPFAYDSLEVGDVKAFVRSDGALFEHNVGPGLFSADTNIGLINGAGLWIGGFDVSGQLHFSAHDWGVWQGTGFDFFPGPIAKDSLLTDSITTANHNRFWKIDRAELDAYLLDFQDNGVIDNPTAYPHVYDWPAFLYDLNGNALPEGAPWIDVDGDPTAYTPDQGDHPSLKGDAMIWWVFNDMGPDPINDRYNPSPLGLEVHAMIYGYDCPEEPLANTLFVEYNLINRTTYTWQEVYMGQWTDFDLGYFADDHVGVDTTLDMYYGYNGNPLDGPSGFGLSTPAVGMQFLQGATPFPNDLIDNDRDGIVDEPGERFGITAFMAYPNDFTITPVTSTEYYNYLLAFLPNGLQAVDNYSNGGVGNGNPDSSAGSPVNFMYPGDVCQQVGWTMGNANRPPADYRAIGSVGYFALDAGASDTIAMSYIISKGSSSQQNLCDLMDDGQYVKNWFAAEVESCVIPDLVYPGDANHDQVADAWDIFPIGLHYQQVGTPRANASLNWIGQPATDWTDSLASGVNIKHVDTDGNATIEQDDTLAIDLNYGLTHLSLRDNDQVDGAPFYFIVSDTVIDPGDTIEVSVWLGTMDTLALDVYGIAFSLDYDTSQVETLSVDMNPSWLGTNGVDLLTFSKNLPDAGRLDIAQVRLDQVNVSGYGRLANIIVVMDDDIAKALLPFTMNVSRINMIDADENELEVSVEPLNANISTGLATQLSVPGLMVYPNPTQNELYVRWAKGPATQVRLWDMQGQLIATERSPQGESEIRLELNALPKGLYLLEIVQGEKRSTQSVLRQ